MVEGHRIDIRQTGTHKDGHKTEKDEDIRQTQDRHNTDTDQTEDRHWTQRGQ